MGHDPSQVKDNVDSFPCQCTEEPRSGLTPARNDTKPLNCTWSRKSTRQALHSIKTGKRCCIFITVGHNSPAACSTLCSSILRYPVLPKTLYYAALVFAHDGSHYFKVPGIIISVSNEELVANKWTAALIIRPRHSGLPCWDHLYSR